MIAYASQTLNHEERNYDAHKLEFLALKWAVTDHFHKYLYGATFEVYTDNNPLTYILTTAKLDPTGHRWVASLGPYNFSLHYKSNKLNSDADTLSRIDWQSVGVQKVKTTMDLAQLDTSIIVEPSVFQETSDDVPVMKSLRTGDTTRKWQQRQQEDPEIKTIIQMIKNETWAHYRYSKKDPESMKGYVKVRSELMVHLGIDRTTILMTDRFYWPKIADKIRKYFQNCERCIRFKQQPHQDEMVPIDA